MIALVLAIVLAPGAVLALVFVFSLVFVAVPGPSWSYASS